MQSVYYKLVQMRNLWIPYINNFALDTGLLPGQKEYIRFIILGRSRVGSNFLRGLLNSHPQIVVYAEIFQNKSNIDWGLQGHYQSKPIMQLFHEQPVDFISKKVFGKFPEKVRAVGFKIFYYHAQDDKWAPVWDYLRSDMSIRVIHLKRRNILRTHLSRKRAVLEDSWINITGTSDKNSPITLNYEECLADFTQTRGWEKQYDLLFQDHPKLEIVYEDLSSDYTHQLTKIQEFLDVEKESVAPQTFKQATKPLSQTINNYKELKMLFENTQWAEFFSED